MLVLERWGHAAARGARIHAELAGHGMSADGGDLTAPDAEGAADAMQAALLDADSVLVGVSSRGETRETLDVLRAARRAGATTVSITNATSSSLDDVSDVVLRSAVRESRLRSGATASRIAQLAIVDVLFVLVLRQDFARLSESLRVTYDAVRSRRGDA